MSLYKNVTGDVFVTEIRYTVAVVLRSKFIYEDNYNCAGGFSVIVKAALIKKMITIIVTHGIVNILHRIICSKICLNMLINNCTHDYTCD